MAYSDITSAGTSVPLESPVLDDRRNEFYSLKRFVFISLGIPQAPAVQPRCGTICSVIAIPFYILLCLWGFMIIITSVIIEDYIWHPHCSRFFLARIFSLLGGLFFVLLGIYWIILFWWHKCHKSDTEAHHKNFTPMACLFWFLSTAFTIIVTVLSMEVVRNRDIIFSLGNSDDNFVKCGSNLMDTQTDVVHVPNNFMPAITLCSLLLLLGKYLCVMVVLNVSSFVKHRPCSSTSRYHHSQHEYS